MANAAGADSGGRAPLGAHRLGHRLRMQALSGAKVNIVQRSPLVVGRY